MFGFKDPKFLYLLLLVPIFLIYLFKVRKTPYLNYSSAKFLKQAKSWKVRLKFLPEILKIIAFILLVVALARPRKSMVNMETKTEGIDIIITLDVSTSMLARDFEPNRFEAAREVAKEFIAGRKNDRIGFVVFSGESYTQCPLTSDYKILVDMISKIKMKQIEDGTAIGNALSTSINRLKDSKAKSKVIILLTDGENNKGNIDPETAAEAAKALGIRIYTIGIGNKIAPYPTQDFFGNIVYRNAEFHIDEEMLGNIAKITKGLFFRAKNENKLKQIYQEIDQLEKTKISTKTYKRYQEEYFKYAITALIFLIISILLEQTILKRSL